MGSINVAVFFVAVLIMIIAIFQFLEIKSLKKRVQVMTKIKETLYTVGESVSKAQDDQEVYSIVLEAAISLIPTASKGSILILEEDGNFHYRAVKGYSEHLFSMSLKKEEVFLHNINNFSETAVIVNPLEFDENTIDKEKTEELKNYEALDITCCMSSPIYLNEKLVGLINVDSVIKNKAFTKEDLKIMNHIKNELQLALKNSFIRSKLKYMANYDELTGLYNRRYFKQLFQKELEKIKRFRYQTCIAVIDLDDFKYINDNYGHNTGDNALKYFADALRQSIRKSDIFARMSGDEFIILFINCDKQEAEKRLEELRSMLKSRPFESMEIRFSYGIAVIDCEEEFVPDDIFGTADKEMYRQKKLKCKLL